MFIPLHDANRLRAIKAPYVTYAILAINLLIFFYTGTSGFVPDESAQNAIFITYGYTPALANHLAQLPAGMETIPVPLTYITYAFFHVDFLHLIGNMLFLWVFADNVEDAMGHYRFPIFYGLCCINAAFVHGHFHPQSDSPLIGASGAVAGVIGAYLILHPKVKIWILAFGRIPLRLSAMWVLGGWFLFQVLSIVFDGGSVVSFAAHLGGFFTGAILIFLFKNKDTVLFDKNLN